MVYAGAELGDEQAVVEAMGANAVQMTFERVYSALETEMSEAEKKRFQEAVLPVYERFCGDYMDIIDAIAAEGLE